MKNDVFSLCQFVKTHNAPLCFRPFVVNAQRVSVKIDKKYSTFLDFLHFMKCTVDFLQKKP